MHLLSKAFETWGWGRKGETALNRQFLLFPPYFPFLKKKLHSDLSNFIYPLQAPSNMEKFKIGIPWKIKRDKIMSLW